MLSIDKSGVNNVQSSYPVTSAERKQEDAEIVGNKSALRGRKS